MSTPSDEEEKEFVFGRPSQNGWCCNKPVGCTMRPEGCLFTAHPWKLRYIDGIKPLFCGPCTRGEHECPGEWNGYCDCPHLKEST